MNSVFDFDAWAEWFQSLDTAWLFLLIMGLVVAVIRFWSKSLWPENSEAPAQEEHKPEP